MLISGGDGSYNSSEDQQQQQGLRGGTHARSL